tara:strand:- start:323 stop:667 length:345 start_codon:yes stop_codon:yes gene_type:complete
MASIYKKSFISPDTLVLDKGSQLNKVCFGAITVTQIKLEKDWSWSSSIQAAGSQVCLQQRVGAVLQGCLIISHDDGTQVKVGAGEAYSVAPGHDLWVHGDEDVVAVEFEHWSIN